MKNIYAHNISTQNMLSRRVLIVPCLLSYEDIAQKEKIQLSGKDGTARRYVTVEQPTFFSTKGESQLVSHIPLSIGRYIFHGTFSSHPFHPFNNGPSLGGSTVL
jgi:hypothetical protein